MSIKQIEDVEHKLKHASSMTPTLPQVEVQGLCLEVQTSGIGWDRMNSVNSVTFFMTGLFDGCLLRGNKPYFGKYALQIQEEALQIEGNKWSEKCLKIRFGVRKISHTWGLATCEAWINSTNIEACRRMMVSWRWIPRSWWYDNANGGMKK